MSEDDTAKARFFEGLDFLDRRDFASAQARFAQAQTLAPRNIAVLNNLAVALFEQGKIGEAARIAQDAIAIDGKNVDAYVMLMNCQCAEQQYDRALATCDAIIALDAGLAEAHGNRGFALNHLKRYGEALASHDQAIRLQPRHATAYLNRGNALAGLKRYAEALDAFDQALAIDPRLTEATIGRCAALAAGKRFAEASAAYASALALKPDLLDALIGSGSVFVECKRYDAALAAFDRALAIKPGLAEAWLGRGNAFFELKRADEAAAAYDKALAIKPGMAAALLGRGNVLLAQGRHADALAAYDEALAAAPDLAAAWLGRGNVMLERNRHDEAFAAYDKALALAPDLAEAWLGRGNASAALKRYGEALAAYDKALALDADAPTAEGARLNCKMRLCDWSDFDADRAHLIAAVKNNKTNTTPFVLLNIDSSPQDQLQCARSWVADKCPPSTAPLWRGERYRHDKIRLGYVSADFGEHPVALLSAGMFESHDRSAFETTAISIGPDENSPTRKRLKASFERFIDAAAYADDQIARTVKDLEIDILVDMTGLTGGARTNVFARRPAPLAVSFLGYLATMGADYIDYIVADRIVVPDHHRQFYAEKIVYLPNSFQPTDRERRIADKTFTRAELGLPRQGFVFCCFNTSYKITPAVYDSWMRILKQVPESVLWLVALDQTVARNLRNEAAARGIAAERLIFAPQIPLPEHQARLRAADLFLDTWPYNAGATASDTLWAGLPVLTCMGNAFVGRMAASVLNAIDLPELVTTTPQDYERMAVDLALHPEKLAAIKSKLNGNRLAAPLFDTGLFTRHIEAAYTAMYERRQKGLPPDHIVVKG